MALKNDFYSEIFNNEKKWTELINQNLLNSIYCNLTLKPFYLKKRNEIMEEYTLTNNQILNEVLFIIENILRKIEYFTVQYNNSKEVDIKELLPLFLINQMSNTNQKENEVENYKKVI